MERVISQDERIRRAEELYARRKLQMDNKRSATVNVDKKGNNKITKKLIIQSVICILIYISFYTIKNIPNLVSQDLMYKISDILEYDINIQEIYNNFTNYINRKKETTSIEQNNELAQGTLSAVEMTESNTSLETTNQSQIETPVETISSEDTSSLSQMEIDSEYIKANYSIIKPLEGEITSRYGIRNPTVITVPKYHTGIDIARIEGTVIIASMAGTVELVSGEGDYGNHIKITNGEVSTLYAHCKTIYVKQGDTITQGQQIAEVGATGNVTGPHLHFEIRRNNQYVDPDLILEF